MSVIVFGHDASYWYSRYLEETRLAQARGRNVRDQEVRLNRQRRTIVALEERVADLENALSEAQNGASDAPVESDGTSTLEERINTVERYVESVDGYNDSLADAIGDLQERLRKLENDAQRRNTINVDFGGATMDAAALVTKAVNEALNSRAGRSRNV